MKLYLFIRFSVEIVPVNKDDVVCLPPKFAHTLGGIKQICIVQRVNNEIHLIEPTIAQCKSMVLRQLSVTLLTC